jgi:hypothetical protein
MGVYAKNGMDWADVVYGMDWADVVYGMDWADVVETHGRASLRTTQSIPCTVQSIPRTVHFYLCH